MSLVRPERHQTACPTRSNSFVSTIHHVHPPLNTLETTAPSNIHISSTNRSGLFHSYSKRKNPKIRNQFFSRECNINQTGASPAQSLTTPIVRWTEIYNGWSQQMWIRSFEWNYAPEEIGICSAADIECFGKYLKYHNCASSTWAYTENIKMLEIIAINILVHSMLLKIGKFTSHILLNRTLPISWLDRWLAASDRLRLDYPGMFHWTDETYSMTASIFRDRQFHGHPHIDTPYTRLHLSWFSVRMVH